MKNIRLSLAAFSLAATCASAPAFAQFYLGASAGYVNHSMNQGDWNPGAAFGKAYDDTDYGMKAFGGYRFTKHWAAEAGYSGLGKYTANLSGVADSGKADVKVSSAHLFAVGSIPLSDKASLVGKIGMSYNESDMSFSSGGVALRRTDQALASRTSTAFGIGLHYAFSRNVGMRVEFEDYGKAGDTTNTMTVAGRSSQSHPRMGSIGFHFGF